MGPVGFPNGLKIEKEEILATLNRYALNKNSEFLIILDDEKKEIGEFSYSVNKRNVGTFNIKIGELSSQGLGYGKSAVMMGIERIRKQTKAFKIEIRVAPENVKALNLYLDLGFKKNILIEDDWVDQLGNSRTTMVLELLL